MSRRDFRTPASLPLETTGRCIIVPNDSAWLGLLNAALLMLTEQWRYDQVEPTDLTPEETAAIWYDIYVSTLTSNCEDCSDMNCNDVLECMLPYLEASFYEDADIRINPVTNAPQVSYDGGTTWSDIPQSGDGSINAPQPTPTSGANDNAKICLAASRAALVIAEFYKQSFGAFTADLYNALGTANTFLQDVKMVLFNAIYSPYDGILEAAGFLTQDFETNYTAAELSSGALESLLCLLIENASVDASGVVTFDYGAVRDNIIADVGINPGTALWFLLGNMQEVGLNTAGSVHITDTALNCAVCSDCSEPIKSGAISPTNVAWSSHLIESGYIDLGPDRTQSVTLDLSQIVPSGAEITGVEWYRHWRAPGPDPLTVSIGTLDDWVQSGNVPGWSSWTFASPQSAMSITWDVGSTGYMYLGDVHVWYQVCE